MTTDDNNIEHRQYLHPSTASNTKLTTFKPFPSSIIQTIQNERQQRFAQRNSINQLSFETTDDDIDDNYETTTTTTDSSPKHSVNVNSSRRFPSEIQINIYPAVLNEQLQIPQSTYSIERRNSDITLTRLKASKQTRVENLRRVFLEHRLGRRIHSSFSSTSTIRSLNQRRSIQPFRRPIPTLSRNSKWHFVRQHLHDIAMMNESYARMKLIERDLRWNYLREEIRKHVIDMREMSILRQQDEQGIIKSSLKTNFDLKSIPTNEVVHVERDGRVYSIATRDLVLGRLINHDDIQLDTFAHLDARRKVAVKQDLLRQQEGRNRLKKHIAFSFCLCNLSLIVLMFAAMFICVMKTIIELKIRENF